MPNQLGDDFQIIDQSEHTGDELTSAEKSMAIPRSSNTAQHRCKWKNCDFSSSEMMLLLNHTQGHVGFKRNGTFKPRCEWEDCHFSKNSRAKIKEHITSHFSCRPHQCSQCSCSFKNPRHLSKHAKTKHSGIPENRKGDAQHLPFDQDFGSVVIVNRDIDGLGITNSDNLSTRMSKYPKELKKGKINSKPFFKPYFLPDHVPASYLTQIYEYPHDQYYFQNNIPPPVYSEFSTLNNSMQVAVPEQDDLNIESDLYSILFSD